MVSSLRHVVVSARADAPLDERQRSVVDAVMEYYGAPDDTTLSDVTRSESPWLTARGDLPEDALCSAPISSKTMLHTYSAQSRAGKGSRPAVGAIRRVANMADVLRCASDASKRWDRTLSLLTL